MMAQPNRIQGIRALPEGEPYKNKERVCVWPHTPVIMRGNYVVVTPNYTGIRPHGRVVSNMYVYPGLKVS